MEIVASGPVTYSEHLPSLEGRVKWKVSEERAPYVEDERERVAVQREHGLGLCSQAGLGPILSSATL